MSIVTIIALAFLIVSFVLAIIYSPNLQSPLLWAVWALDVAVIFGGIVGLGGKIL